MIASQSDFCCCYKTGSLFFYCVDIWFVSAGIKTDSFQDFFFCNIRGYEGCKAVFSENVKGVHYEGFFEENRFVFKIVEFRTGNLCSPFKVNQVQFFSQFYVALRLESEFSWRTGFFYFQVFCVQFSDGRVRVAHIWKLAGCFVKSGFCFWQLFFCQSHVFLDSFALIDEFLTGLWIQFLLHICSVFVSFLLQGLKPGRKGSAFIVKFNDKIRICFHVAVFYVCLYFIKMFFYKF